MDSRKRNNWGIDDFGDANHPTNRCHTWCVPPPHAPLPLPAAPATFSSGSSGYGKRSAEPHGLGVAVHPGLATSFVGRTVHGLPHYGKRDAEAEPEAAPEAAADAEADADAFYGLYGYAAPYGVYGGYGYGWPGGYTSVSGLYGYPYWG